MEAFKLLKQARVTPKQALNLYLTLALFPGCYCSASWAYSLTLTQHRFGGLLLFSLPFIYLSVMFLLRVKFELLTPKEKRDALKMYLFSIFAVGLSGIFAILAAIDATEAFAASEAQGVHVDYQPFMQILWIWTTNCLAGFLVLIVGLFRLARLAKPQYTYQEFKRR